MKTWKLMIGTALLAAVAGGCGEGFIAGGDLSDQASASVTAAPFVQLNTAQRVVTYEGGQPYTTVRYKVVGVIEVENAGYEKQVFVHANIPGDTWSDFPATYQSAGADNHEFWRFELPEVSYMPYWGASSVTFAIRYQVNGQEIWDSNGGRDYRIHSPGRGAGGPTYALGSAPVKALTGLVTGNTLQVEIGLLNLAYAKQVGIVYTTDGWRTSATASGSFRQVDSPALETWLVETPLPDATRAVTYAVWYSVAGRTFWDNNFGQDYTITP